LRFANSLRLRYEDGHWGKAVLNIAPAFAGWRLTPDPAYKTHTIKQWHNLCCQQNRTTNDGTISVGPRKQRRRAM
jgi:hypothetical protein